MFERVFYEIGHAEEQRKPPIQANNFAPMNCSQFKLPLSFSKLNAG